MKVAQKLLSLLLQLTVIRQRFSLGNCRRIGVEWLKGRNSLRALANGARRQIGRIISLTLGAGKPVTAAPGRRDGCGQYVLAFGWQIFSERPAGNGPVNAAIRG